MNAVSITENPATLGTRKLYSVIAFSAGAFRMLSIPLVGQMPVAELILLVLLGHYILWLVLQHRAPTGFAQPRVFGLLVFCQVVGLFGYVISDLVRGSFPVDMIRGWMRMIFLLMDVIAFALIFSSDPGNFIAVQIGSCFSGLQFLLMRPIFGDYWKFAFATPLTIAVLLLVPKWFGRWTAVATCFGLGLLHVVMDFRSMAGICFIIGAIQFLFVVRPFIRKIILVTATLVVLFALPSIVQKAFAETEGRANRSNVERSAMLQAAWEGFVESPFIGHGSWFSRSNVMDNFLSIRKTQSTIGGGGGMGFDNSDFEGVTIHSQIVTAMAEGGIFGATFFYVLVALILWSLWYILSETSWTWLTPIRLFVLSCSLFDVVMAPFSGIHRLNISITTALTLLLLNESLRQKGVNARKYLEPHLISQIKPIFSPTSSSVHKA